MSAPSGVDDTAGASAGERRTGQLSDEQYVRDVVSYWATGEDALRSDDGDKALIMATVTGDEAAVNEQDVITGELIVFPITMVALVFVFGGMVAALLPLAVAAVTAMTAGGAHRRGALTRSVG